MANTQNLEEESPKEKNQGDKSQTSLHALVEMPMPITGPVKLIRENVAEHFGKTRIAQYGGDFRMFSPDNEGFKVTLDPLDALWIIETRQLRAETSALFGRAVVWHQ